MARKEITTPLDLKNLGNHNSNYDELYGLVDETDRRISEDMWEEIKDANTMKMLEPVQTAADLPSEAADKSLITVIDEQRVYGFVHGEWQPFSEIDLDPFEPFKDELAEIVAAYEKQIQNITQEVQSTKDSAIESIESTQSQISDSTAALKGKTEELTALFNDSMDKLASKQDTALAEVASAKQAAITEIEDFQSIDTSNWQKYKLTNDDGGAKALSEVDWADTSQLDALDTGEYYATSTINPPAGSSSYNAFVSVFKRAGGGIRRIEFRPYGSNQLFIKRFYKTWSDWEPAQGTKVELFSGSLSELNKNISLKDDPRNYSFLMIELHHIGGDDTSFVRFLKNYVVSRSYNLGNSGNGATLIEISMKLDSEDPTQIYVESGVRVETDTATGREYVPEIQKLVGVK